MPEFLEVVLGRTLGRLDPERRVAARAAAARNAVAPLHLLRQREEGAGFPLGPGDEIRRNAVVGDDREAEALERLAELRGEAFRIGGGCVQRDGGNGGSRAEERRHKAGFKPIRPSAPEKVRSGAGGNLPVFGQNLFGPAGPRHEAVGVARQMPARLIAEPTQGPVHARCPAACIQAVSNKPASAALIKLASEPAISALMPSLAITGR